MAGHPWFAALYDPLTWWGERRVLGPLRRRLLEDLRGRVLDIGVGTGASLPHYGPAHLVVAADPDAFMLRRAVRKARPLRWRVAFVQCAAEALPFAQSTFDAVVATLVLCTVDDPDRAAAEAHRVLRPEGTLRFLEHVRAEDWREPLQDAIAPLWQRVSAGCHPNRRTAEVLRRAGFVLDNWEERDLGATPLIAGAARSARAGTGAGVQQA